MEILDLSDAQQERYLKAYDICKEVLRELGIFPAKGSAEQERLVRDLGGHKAMILRNHGLLAAGTTIRDAFEQLYYLERACEAQVRALGGGVEVIECDPEIAEKVAVVLDRPGRSAYDTDWPALLRWLDRTDGSYRE